MNNDFLDPINAENMPREVDSALAMSFLLNAKTGVRNTAFAIAEAASPEVRALLRAQLTEALALQREISDLMMKKGWFHPYHMTEQYDLDMRSSETVVKIASLDLWPDDTSRDGLFATPNK